MLNFRSGRSSVGGLRRLDGPVDVAVDPLAPDPVDQPVGLQDGGDVGLYAGQAELDATRRRSKSWSSVELRRSLRVDEVHALEVQHERVQVRLVRGRRSRTRSSSAPAVAKNSPPSMPDDRHAGIGLVVRVLVELAEHLRARLATQDRHRRAGRDVDEPDQREHHPDDDAERARRPTGRRRSPRSRSRSRTASPGGAVGTRATSIIPNTTASMMIAASTALGSSENSGASRISVAIDDRRRWRATRRASSRPADSFSELADRLVETGIPWNTPGADVRHALGDGLLVQVDAIAMPRRRTPGRRPPSARTR